jgi:long-chain fatty acid transport protein
MRIVPAAVLLLMPAVALAGGYQVPNTNTRDLGLADSTVSSTEGAEATYVNVATLAQHQGLLVTGAVALVQYSVTWIDPSHVSPNVTNTRYYAPPLAGGVAWGTKLADHGFGIGLSFDNPGGGQIYWPKSWPGASEIISVDRRVYEGTLGVGFEAIRDWLMVGVSLIYDRTTEQLIQALPLGTTTGQADLGLGGGQFSFGAGLEFTIPHVPFALGVQYQQSANQPMTGNVHFSNVPVPFQSSLIDQPVKESLTFPTRVNVGVSYNILERCRILFAYQWTQWTLYGQDLFVGQTTGFTVTVPRGFHNENTMRLGAEIFAAKWLRFFLGGQRDLTPAPVTTLSPTLPDSSSWGGTIGVSFDVLPQLSIAGSYAYFGFDQVSAVGADAFPATYQSHANIASVGLQFRWL